MISNLIIVFFCKAYIFEFVQDLWCAKQISDVDLLLSYFMCNVSGFYLISFLILQNFMEFMEMSHKLVSFIGLLRSWEVVPGHSCLYYNIFIDFLFMDDSLVISLLDFVFSSIFFPLA